MGVIEDFIKVIKEDSLALIPEIAQSFSEKFRLEQISTKEIISLNS